MPNSQNLVSSGISPAISPSVTLPIIGYIRSPLSQKFGIPRQPNLVDVPATIELLVPYSNPLAFEGIENFSHLWVVWQFHQNHTIQEFRPQVRPPRLGGNQKIGVFATRSMYRPANIGLSVVKLDKIIINNHQVTLHIVGGDMVDGTPIIDIKPYIAYSDNIMGAKSGFAQTKPNPKTVKILPSVYQTLAKLPLHVQLSDQDCQIITELLAQDPRPAYRQQELQTEFIMRYRKLDVVFFQQDETTLVWCEVRQC